MSLWSFQAWRIAHQPRVCATPATSLASTDMSSRGHGALTHSPPRHCHPTVTPPSVCSVSPSAIQYSILNLYSPSPPHSLRSHQTPRSETLHASSDCTSRLLPHYACTARSNSPTYRVAHMQHSAGDYVWSHKRPTLNRPHCARTRITYTYAFNMTFWDALCFSLSLPCVSLNWWQQVWNLDPSPSPPGGPSLRLPLSSTLES